MRPRTYQIIFIEVNNQKYPSLLGKLSLLSVIANDSRGEETHFEVRHDDVGSEKRNG